jgi:hypothetical protein
LTDTYEARGPHLPDVMTRVSPWVYLFLGAALVHVWLGWLQLSESGVPIDLGAIYQVEYRLDQTVITLFGAALFLRHPDARRCLPFLAFGVGLLALGPLLDLVETPISQFLESLAPSGESVPGYSPAAIAYRVLTSLIGVAAVLYLGVGLSDARRRPRHDAERSIFVLFVIIAIATVAWQLLPLGSAGAPSTPFEWVVVGIGFVLSLGYSLAWSYVIAVGFGGWMAGDEPRLAWGLAFAAGAIGIGARIVNTLFILIANLSQPISSSLFPVVSGAVTLSWVLLLVAFAIGLPSPAGLLSADALPATDGLTSAADEPATGDRSEATPPGSEVG